MNVCRGTRQVPFPFWSKGLAEGVLDECVVARDMHLMATASTRTKHLYQTWKRRWGSRLDCNTTTVHSYIAREEAGREHGDTAHEIIHQRYFLAHPPMIPMSLYIQCVNVCESYIVTCDMIMTKIFSSWNGLLISKFNFTSWFQFSFFFVTSKLLRLLWNR